ncbi:MAG: flagellar type III secretion system pore protein FliP [Oligoflexia bacterium]|nr:flagellar type III secretion system pore protein FliP [Oligoflexia bacterium]
MRRRAATICCLTIGALACASSAWAEADVSALPSLAINIGGSSLSSDGSVSATLKLLILLTILSFVPAMILTMTCFTRIAVVLGMTRTALGTQSMPPNMVITGLALFLTMAIMNPIFGQMYDQGIKPFLDGQMEEKEAMTKMFSPLKTFLVRHAREKDLALFLDITKSEAPADVADVPLQVAVPAFVLSELNLAFQIGFLIALPFLVLDMVVSSVLTSMSMITLPPVVISLPLKLMLFVLVDGWHLIIGSLVATYHV